MGNPNINNYESSIGISQVKDTLNAHKVKGFVDLYR